MLWDQRFEASMMLRLLVRRVIFARSPRGKVILAIARNRYKESARQKGIAAGAAASFAIDEVLRTIDCMENRQRRSPELASSSTADCDADREASLTAKAA